MRLQTTASSPVEGTIINETNSTHASPTQRLVMLELEEKRLSERMRQIRKESEGIYAGMRSRITPEFFDRTPSALSSTRSSKHSKRSKAPKYARPVNDRLIIAAGRAIVGEVRRGGVPDTARVAAIHAATRVANRYRMDDLPPEVLVAIEKKIKLRYSIYS